MLPALIKEYSELLENWIGEVERERKTLETTRSPIRFQQSFINLVARLAYFDSLHAQITDLTGEIERKTKSYTDQKISLAPVKQTEDTGGFFERKKVKPAKRKTSPVATPRTYGEQPAIELRAWHIFNEVIQELEHAPEKYTQLGKTYLMEVLANWNVCIGKINNMLDRSPPPEPAEIQPLIRELMETVTIWEKTKVKQKLEKFVPGTAYTTAVYRLVTGQDNLKLLNNQKLPLKNSQPWQDQEVVKLREQVRDEQRKINDRLQEYGKQASVAPKVLKILDQMNPEFPVFLPRLAELTEMEKEETEKALKFVLQLSPDIGKYDAMSQVLVFNKPSDVEKLIDDLLKQYETSPGDKTSSEKKNRR